MEQLISRLAHPKTLSASLVYSFTLVALLLSAVASVTIRNLAAPLRIESKNTPLGRTSDSAKTPAAPALSVLITLSGDAADSAVGDGHCDTDGNLGNGDQCTLRAAIQETNSAVTDDTIFASPGVNNISLATELDPINGNLLLGGNGITALGVQRSSAGGTPNFRIFTINAGKTVTLSNLTISNGRTADGVMGSASAGPGGGILNAGTLTLTNTTVSGNTTGVGFDFGSGGKGGGIYNTGTLTLNNSIVSGNTTGTGGPAAGGGNGGGIWTFGTLTLTNSTVTGNRTGNGGDGSAGGYGGGLFDAGGSSFVTITNSTVSNNQTGGGGMVAGAGGGIACGGAVTLTNSTVSGNRTGDGGNGNGGGIYTSGSLTLTNSTLSSNITGTSAGGGGIYSLGSTTLASCTVSGNQAAGGGGGMANLSGTTNLANTIVANNMAGSGGSSDDLSGTFTSQDYNLIEVITGATINGTTTHNITGDPNLGPLANNGGPSFTHALLRGSPAIDAGNSLLTTDQRGFPRPIDDLLAANAPGSNASDIGSYEAHSFEVNSTGDAGDGLCTPVGTGDGCTLREAITVANAETGGEVITFSPDLTPGTPATISLLTALPDLASDMMINGPGANLLTVQRSTAGGMPDFRIFNINSGKTVSIASLTISNGSLSGTGNNGGGVRNAGTLTLINCNIFGNSVPTQVGGGIFSDGPSLTLIACQVGGTGPGQANTSGASGAGVFNSSGTLLMTGGSIEGNSGNGIAIAGTGTLNGVTISNNSGANSGGGVLVFGTANIQNCLISNNSASSSGGGIHTSLGTANVVNSTVSGNSCTNSGGGGVVSFNGTVILTNVTVTNNRSSASNFGGGIDVLGGITLHNTIVAGNFRGPSPSTTSDDINGLINGTSSFNLVGDGTRLSGVSNGLNGNEIGTALAPINPRLGALANNGGPTQTHSLLTGSPALDAGNNALVTNPPFGAPPFTDQRRTGFGRIIDGPDADTTATVDIGAFEAQVSVADISDQTINEDGSLSLPFNVGGAASITSVEATSSNTGLVPNNPTNISISGGGSSRTLQINPVANASGASTITVTINGSNSQTMTDTFLLTVNSVNDPPTDIALSSNSVADNSPGGTTVGTFSSSDPEVGDTFTYSLVFGAGSVDNASFTISGNQLITNSIFDFESKSSYSIRVRSTDQSNGFLEKQFVITVADGPDSPGAISFSSASYNVGEGDGSANVALTRSGGTDNKVVAKVSLADVTTSPADYVFKPGTFDSSFNVGTGATSGSSAIPQFVKSVLLQPDGKTVIGGAFLFFNGTPRSRIARINANGTLDTSFDPGTGANNHILAMALQPDGKIIIGGMFTIYNGTSRLRIARLNSDGTLDANFGGVPDDAVRALAIQPDGKIIIAGDFFLYNGISCNRIARLNSDGSLDFSFNPGLGSNAGVTALALQPDGKILVGGGFTNFGTASNTRLIRLNSNGSLDGSFNSATLLSLVPRQIVLQPNGKLLIGGEFINTDSPLGRRGIARLNDNGSEDVSFNPGTGTDGNTVEAVVLQPDGKIIIGGQFTTYNSTPASRIARLNTTGALDGTFNPAAGADFPVLAAALQPDGKIIIGGQYTFYDNLSSNGITRINGDLFVTWQPGDGGNKTITLPIVDDAQDEPNETLTFTVTPLIGGATTGSNPTATLTVVDNDPSVTTLSSVSGSGVFSGTANLTATLMSLGSPLSGKTVNFTLNSTAVGNAITNINGVATLTGVSMAGINAGFYATAVGASFTGDANYSSSSSNGPLNVGKAGTATSVASSVNPSAFGQSVTFTATVTSPAGIPGGTVQFKSDASNLGAPATLNASGVASFTTSTLTPGTHTIRAEYSGNTNFTVSTGTLASAQTVTPSLAIDDVSSTEGDSGTKSTSFTVTLAAASNQTITANFATANGTATAGSDYQSISGIVTFNPGQTTQTVSVTINGDVSFEPDETFFVNLSNSVNATIGDNQGQGTILNDDAQGGFIAFSQALYAVEEGDGYTTITVTRTNDVSGPATVDYFTRDYVDSVTEGPCSATSNIASSRCDYTSAAGTLRFAAGETSKTFLILVSQDTYSEGPESLSLTLSNLTGGAGFGNPSTSSLMIGDDTFEPPTNPIDSADAFVRQHYHDFLNREADEAGLAFWTNQITECQQPGATCNAEVRRINVSAAFFLSIEFQETGYLVYRFYKSAYGNLPGTPVPLRLSEFLPDTQQIGKDVVIGQPGAEQQLEANKVAYALEFVSRSRFTTAYPTTLTPVEFVDALFANGGVTPSVTDRDAAINEFGVAGNTTDTAARARALRRVAENSILKQQETNKAFVLMQYFGYLRRNPNDPPELGLNFDGYNFWLGKLNQFNGNFVEAEMVKAFIVSGEYRQRFGPQ